MSLPRLLIFASGSKDGGGSGFQVLAESAKKGQLQADIVGVVSNHASGGVYQLAQKLSIPFFYMPKPYDAKSYRWLVEKFDAEWVSLSGWLKLICGLDPSRTFNIHPGPLPDFGGPGLYGHHVHEAVMQAFRDGKITCTAITMHFVDEKYDHGQVFFRYPIAIRNRDTAETLAKRVNSFEHVWQPFITNLVVQRKIRLENNRVIVPEGYAFL